MFVPMSAAVALVFVLIASAGQASQCKEGVYVDLTQQQHDISSTLFITELSISNTPAIDLCPQNPKPFTVEGQQVDPNLPIYFWFRLQGTDDAIRLARAAGNDDIILQVFFYRFSVGEWSLVKEGEVPVELDGRINLGDMQREADGNVEEGLEPIFDWRGDFEKGAGLFEEGSYRVSLVAKPSTIIVACHSSLDCSKQALGADEFIQISR
jgi:hypothetical protein